MMTWVRPIVIAAGVFGAACSDHVAQFAPSPIMIPDAATLRVGDAQTFSVYNAVVRQFTVRSTGRPSLECVQLDSGAEPEQSARLIVTARCEGLVYLTADIGAHHAPLVAAVAVE